MTRLLKHRQVGVLVGVMALPLAIVSAEQTPGSIDRPGIAAVMLEVIDIEDPIPVGDTATYLITATNQGSAPQTNMKVVVI